MHFAQQNISARPLAAIYIGRTHTAPRDRRDLRTLIASAIREGIEAWLKTRASYLEYGIRELLQDKDGKGLCSELFKHPLIQSLFSGDYSPRPASKAPLQQGGNLPSYIPSRNKPRTPALPTIVRGLPCKSTHITAVSPPS